MPDKKTIEKSIILIEKGGANYKYFFDNLKSPDWIDPLKKAGYFTNPPPPDIQVNSIYFQFWPESQYLVRMAENNPEEVLNTILDIDTDNVRVHEDFADAVLMMPPELAVRWVKKEIEWVSRQLRLHYLIPIKLGKMIKKLVKDNMVDVALDLAQTLFEVLPGDEDMEEVLESTYSRKGEPTVKFEQQIYTEILKKYYLPIIDSENIKGISLLCDLLDKTLLYSVRRDEDPPYDGSEYWLHDFSGDIRSGELKTLLSSFLLSMIERVIDSNPGYAIDIVEQLKEKNWNIFTRIELYIEVKYLNNIPKKIITSSLLDKDLFDNGSIRYEYDSLLENHFNILEKSESKQILSWIDLGPDVDIVKKNFKEWNGQPMTDKELNSMIIKWKQRRLRPIEDFLPKHLKVLYNRWNEDFGKVSNLKPVVSTASLVGPRSPITKDEMKEMNVNELVKFLRTWKKGDSWSTESPEGLSRLLTELVEEEPAKYSKASELYKSLDPTYVRGFIQGIINGVRNDIPIHWHELLILSKWITEKPTIKIEKYSVHHGDVDPGWNWTKKAISELLHYGLKENQKSIPFKYRNIVWKILEVLADESEPTKEFEEEYGPPNMDAFTLSVNTTRGEAFHALIEYGLWVRRSLEDELGEKKIKNKGFELIPELRETFEEHLLNDPSIAIRSVYGAFFPWIVLMDKKWAIKNKNKIFPIHDEERKFWEASWHTYIVYRRPFDETFELLKEEYKFAIEQMSKSSVQGAFSGDPRRGLAEHIIIQYARGKIPLKGKESLVQLFYDHAPDDVAAIVTSFIGRSLVDPAENITKELITRFKKLWEKRMIFIKNSSNPQEHIEELSQFGWWFTSKTFDDTWSLNYIHHSIDLAKKIDPDVEVVQRLKDFIELEPMIVLDCINLLIEGDKEGFKIFSWKEYAKELLGTALNLDDIAIYTKAKDIIDRLVNRDFREFRDLLKH